MKTQCDKMSLLNIGGNIKISLWILVFSCVFGVFECSNILVVIPSPFYSHQAMFEPLWRKLADRGHNLTILSPFPKETYPNITQIEYDSVDKVFEEEGIIDCFKEDSNMFVKLRKILGNIRNIFERLLAHPKIEYILKDGTKYDLLFLETFLPFLNPLSTRLDCPLISFTSMDALGSLHTSLGNAGHPGLYPHSDLAFTNPLTFRERLKSTMITVIEKIIVNNILPPMMDDLAQKYFGLDEPDTLNGYAKASLLITHANPIFYPPRPVARITINLNGGLHFTEPRSLPKDLQKFLDNSTDGCIYFSFGSIVNDDFMNANMIEVFKDTFEELSPMKVLWKFDRDSMVDRPKNVLLRQWVPQQDILRHPNIKLFITQGGLHSMEEAIDSAVPMIAVPFYGDQHYNARVMSNKKFGIKLEKEEVTKEVLKSSIQEIIHNPIYKKNIEKLSKISRDQPMTSLEKAVWWTEYVLRHGGTEHLRSPSADIPLYQYFFLDIIAFMTVVLIFMLFLSFYSIKLTVYLFRRIFGKTNKVKVS